MAKEKVSRRDFLRRASLMASGIALVACQPKTVIVEKEKEVTRVVEKEVEKVVKETVEVEKEKVVKETVVVEKEVEKIVKETVVVEVEKVGSHLIGKLEGPEIIRDVSKYPTSFSEAPMLADLVNKGELPPVEQRLPEIEGLMVVQPVHEIGKYGGIWRRGFTGPADGENGNRIVSTDKILFWDYTGTVIAPCVVKSWEVADGGKAIVIRLREGMKWSDGEPFDADDFVYWYEHVYGNKDLLPSPSAEFFRAGEWGEIEKIDPYTVAFKFVEPYPLFEYILAGSTQMGGGQAVRQSRANENGSYAPAHYLSQYNSHFVDVSELNKMAKDEGYDDWVLLYKFKSDWQLNPDLPTLTPWKTVQPINTPTWVLERNPYYWAVDPEGNQLPYLDQIVMTLAENLEVLNLRAIAGEYDEQERHTNIALIPAFIENQERGDYTLYLDPSNHGSDTIFQINLEYDKDPEMSKWLKNADFRRALSLGIDRDQINETFYLGLGTPGSPVVAEASPENPGPEWRTKWHTYDPDQANQMLDDLGLDKKDAEGFRLRTDGQGRLRIEVMTTGGAFLPWTQHSEMIAQQWRKIGIFGDVQEVERGLMTQRVNASEHMIRVWMNDGSDNLFLYPDHTLPVVANSVYGPQYAQWYISAGEEGLKPEDPNILKALEMFRSGASKSAEERNIIAQEIWKIVVDDVWAIGVVGQAPGAMGVRVVKNDMGNIPTRQMNAQHCRTPGTSHPATFFWKS